eukprot:m.432646 g.432646  ORF g.432646 m.432646 type:complete len:133 (+) comp56752_c0_seq1:71-469(+)
MFSVWMVVALAVGVCARDRYLLYTVNPGEGFNLGRDVYLRVGALMNKLTTDTADHWTLVLPPWTNPHWREGDRDSNWSKFFDLSSLRKAVNCIELDDYIALKGTGLCFLFSSFLVISVRSSLFLGGCLSLMS